MIKSKQQYKIYNKTHPKTRKENFFCVPVLFWSKGSWGFLTTQVFQMIDFSPTWPNNENIANQPNLPSILWHWKMKWDLLSDTFANLINRAGSDLDQYLLSQRTVYSSPLIVQSYEARTSSLLPKWKVNLFTFTAGQSEGLSLPVARSLHLPAVRSNKFELSCPLIFKYLYKKLAALVGDFKAKYCSIQRRTHTYLLQFLCHSPLTLQLKLRPAPNHLPCELCQVNSNCLFSSYNVHSVPAGIVKCECLFIMLIK